MTDVVRTATRDAPSRMENRPATGFEPGLLRPDGTSKRLMLMANRVDWVAGLSRTSSQVSMWGSGGT